MNDVDRFDRGREFDGLDDLAFDGQVKAIETDAFEGRDSPRKIVHADQRAAVADRNAAAAAHLDELCLEVALLAEEGFALGLHRKEFVEGGSRWVFGHDVIS